jgi:hypothetical protein
MLSFPEDDSLFYDPENWRSFATDVDHPDSLLQFDVILSRYLEVNFSEGSFLFKAPENWFGTDTLELSVSDGELADTSIFHVKVLSVNDAPVLSGVPDSIMFNNDTSYVLYMNEYVEDVDHPDSTLSWDFSSTHDSLLFNFDKSVGELVLRAPGFAGTVYFNITVFDDSMAMAEDTMKVVVERVTAIEDNNFTGIPANYELHQNFPNPFNPVTHIRYAVPKSGEVLLRVYNVLGQEVAILVDESKQAGYHVVRFDAARLASGVYFYSLQAGSHYQVRKMIIMK